MFRKKYSGPLGTSNNLVEIKQITDGTKLAEVMPTQSYSQFTTENITLLKSGTFLLNVGEKKEALKATNGAIFKLLELLRIPPTFAQTLSSQATTRLVNSILEDQAKLFIATDMEKKRITSFGYNRLTCPRTLAMTIEAKKEELGLDFVSASTDGEHTMVNFLFRKFRGQKYKIGVAVVSQLSNIVSPVIHMTMSIQGYMTVLVGSPLRVGTKDTNWAVDQVSSLSYKIDAALASMQKTFETGTVTRGEATRINELLGKVPGAEPIKAGSIASAFDALLSHMKVEKTLPGKINICFIGGRLLMGKVGESVAKPASNHSIEELTNVIN